MCNKSKKYGLFWKVLLLSSLCETALAIENCDYAKDLLFYPSSLTNITPSQQKLLFFQSLQFCSNQPKVHNSLAAIFKSEGKYNKAIFHYKKSLKLDKNIYQTWAGLANIYYKQERFPVSVEAYSHICQVNLKSKAKIISMLITNRIFNTDMDKVIGQDSLNVLYDTPRRDALNNRLKNCGITNKVKPKHAFLNLYFRTKDVVLSEEITQQLDEIAAALKTSQFSKIIIHGHTDSRGFAGLTTAESKQRNSQLSLKRAKAIAEALEQRGIAKEHLKTYGHGSKKPIIPGISPEALAKNRRIEIEVKPIIKSPLKN